MAYSEWTTCKIGDLVSTNQRTYSTNDNWEIVNYLDTGNITKNKIKELQQIHTTVEKLPSRARRKVKEGDIIYSTVRPVQNHYGYIQGQPENFLVSTGFTVLTVNRDIAEPKFIYYFLIQNSVVDSLQAIAEQSTTAYPSIKPSDIENVEIKIPKLEEQRRIVSILSMIDDKMGLNDKISQNLKKQVQSTYKAWFVNFESYNGIIPCDWEKSTLGEVAVIKTKSFNPMKSDEVMLEHYSIPAYDEMDFPIFESSLNVKSNKYVLTKDSMLISKLNPTTKRIWRPYCLSENSVCSTEFIVYEAKNKKYNDFIYSIIDSSDFSSFLCEYATGSTNSRQRVRPTDTLDYGIIMPTESVLSEFCSIVEPLYNKISDNIIQNQKLIELRDMLLPKLLKGEIDVARIKI